MTGIDTADYDPPHGQPRRLQPVNPSAGAAGRAAALAGTHPCYGRAFILANGNPGTTGRNGVFGTVTTDSLSIDPTQWGGRATVRAEQDQVTVVVPRTGMTLHGVRDVIGAQPDQYPTTFHNYRAYEESVSPGALLLEANGVAHEPAEQTHQNTTPVIVYVRNGRPCPTGTGITQPSG